jgi:hypothetical protein
MLWRCDACGRTFANRNQTHTCQPLGDLDTYFAKRPPEIRALFDAFADAVRAWVSEAYDVGCQRHLS